MSLISTDRSPKQLNTKADSAPFEALRTPAAALFTGAALACATLPNNTHAGMIPDGAPDLLYRDLGWSYGGPVLTPYGGVVLLDLSYADPKDPSKRLKQKASAVLINPAHAITAANLFYGRTDIQATISTGKTADTHSESYKVLKTFIHPDYTGLQSRTNAPDVAVLRLESEVWDSSFREVPSIPTKDNEYLMAGFGQLETPNGPRQAAPDGNIRAGFMDAASITNSALQLSSTLYKAGSFSNQPLSFKIRGSGGDEGAGIFDSINSLQGIVVSWDEHNTYFVDITNPSVRSFIEIHVTRKERTDPPTITFTETAADIRLTWAPGTGVFNLFSAPSPKGPWNFENNFNVLPNRLLEFKIPKTNMPPQQFFQFVYFKDPLP